MKHLCGNNHRLLGKNTLADEHTLDVSRQDYILNHIEGWQVLITCCEPAAVLRLTGGSLFRLEQGRIIPEAG